MPTKRSYMKADCITFRFLGDEYGALSNFAAYSLRTHEGDWATSEHLYQAAKFPEGSRSRYLIKFAVHPGEAKKVAYQQINQGAGKYVAADWNAKKLGIMERVLQLKFEQHMEYFEELMTASMDLPLVEESTRDGFWGAIPQTKLGNYELIGVNALGRLWMKIRAAERMHS